MTWVDLRLHFTMKHVLLECLQYLYMLQALVHAVYVSVQNLAHILCSGVDLLKFSLGS